MKISDLMKVVEPMEKNSSNKINRQLNMVVNNAFGLAAGKGAKQMEDAVGHDVTKAEAQDVARAALKFTDEHFDGDAKASIAFLKDAHDRAPAIGELDAQELIDSGVAAQMKNVSDNNPAQYEKMLADLNTDPQLLQDMKNNPSEALAAYFEKNQVNTNEILVADNQTKSEPVTGQSDEVTTDNTSAVPKEYEDYVMQDPVNIPQSAQENDPLSPSDLSEGTMDEPFPQPEKTLIVGLGADGVSEVLDTLWEHIGETGELSPEVQGMGDTLIDTLVGQAFETGSVFIGNATDWANDFSEEMGFGPIGAMELNPETGMEIKVPSQLADTLQDVVSSMPSLFQIKN